MIPLFWFVNPVTLLLLAQNKIVGSGDPISRGNRATTREGGNYAAAECVAEAHSMVFVGRSTNERSLETFRQSALFWQGVLEIQFENGLLIPRIQERLQQLFQKCLAFRHLFGKVELACEQRQPFG